MKFFSPEACDTFDEVGAFRPAYEAYRRHLEGLRGVLPEEVLQLAEPSGMENALVVQVDHDRQTRRLRLVLRCGHLEMGYSNLVLSYEGAELSSEHDASLARIARSTKSLRDYCCDLAYQEVDIADGGMIEHRLIFRAFDDGKVGWTWFAIRCRELHWKREPRRTRRLPPSRDRYPNGPRAFEIRRFCGAVAPATGGTSNEKTPPTRKSMGF